MASIPDPPAREGDLAGPDDHGDYEVGAPLREGRGGTIREGRYRRTGRQVTIESIRADLLSRSGFVDRLALIGRQAASLRDAHLLAVYDLVDDEAGCRLVAEWSDAPTLEQRLRHTQVSAGQAIGIVDDILAGLTVLHGASLFHGAVGPDTVLFGPDGGARLAELAICAAAAPAGTRPASDVRDTAHLALELLRPAGPLFDPVRSRLHAAVAAESGDAAQLREDLEAAATAVLGAGWHGGEATVAPRGGRRRLWLVLAVLALAAVGGAVAAGLLLLGHTPAGAVPAGPLRVGGDATLSVNPASAGCDTTFVFVARGSLSGSGTLVYRWEQSDGAATSDNSLPIRADEGAFQLTQAWRLQGSQTVNGSMTLHIIEPVDRRLRQTFRYTCP